MYLRTKERKVLKYRRRRKSMGPWMSKPLGLKQEGATAVESVNIETDEGPNLREALVK